MALPTASASATAARLRRLVREHAARVGVVIVLVVAAGASKQVGPRLIGTVVDQVSARGPHAHTVINEAALGYLALALWAAAMTYFGRWQAAALGEDALAELRTEVFDHALTLPLQTLEQAGTGDLVSRVTGDVATLAAIARYGLPSVCFLLVQLVLATAGLVVTSPVLAAVAVAASTPILLLAARWYLRAAPGRYRAERERAAEWAGALHEAYQGSLTLHALRAAARINRRLAARGLAWVDAELSTTAARNVLRSGIQGGQAAGLAAVLVAGAVLVSHRTLSLGLVVAAALYLVTLIDVLGALLEQLDGIQNAFAATARLVGVCQVLPHSPVGFVAGAADPPGQPGPLPVSLRGVSFGYRAHQPVLRHLDLTIAAGQRVAFVGPSGAGKSTVAKLIAGVHQPWSGQVTVGGCPLAHLNVSGQQRRVILVMQETHTFARTIADNVRLGARPDTTDAQIRAALDTVGALRWVDLLPDGIHTAVGAGAEIVSPGRAQQLALARLLCADPAVVVLDEATANMRITDATRTERGLAAALHNHTVITVIHRLDTVDPHDRVILIENGKIVADGPRDTLIAAGGPFTTLWHHHLTHHRPLVDEP